MPRTYGYALKGQRCFGKHAWGARGRTNVVGALIDKELVSVSLFEGNINTALFAAWLKQDLLPKLPPGCVIVMDNAAFHKNSAMQQGIQNDGHILEYRKRSANGPLIFYYILPIILVVCLFRQPLQSLL